MKNVYDINGLKHFYDHHPHPVLEIDRFSVPQGAVVGLMGPNGSGKSTLLKLLGFIERPSAGEILFNGRPGAPFSDAVRFRVTLLTQTPYLMKRSVFNNIAYGLRIRKERENLRERTYKALAMVGLPAEEFADRQWYELSGGEAQRVALAARIVLRPKVLLLDEPTASVDVASERLIRDASLQARREWGTTLVIASHDWQWLYEVCEEVIHLFRGRVAGSGDVSVLLGPWSPRNDGLWEKSLHDGQSVLVSEPPHKDAAAIIPSERITVDLPEDKENFSKASLDGVISRLVLEKQDYGIIGAVLVGDVPVTVKFTRAQVQELGLYPGQKVRMYYDPKAIKWIGK